MEILKNISERAERLIFSENEIFPQLYFKESKTEQEEDKLVS